MSLMSKRWVATLFDVDLFTSLDLTNSVTFLCAQLEVSPTTQKKHVQLYFELANNARMTKVKAIFENQHADPPGHFEIARGSSDQCIEYCTKEESRVSEDEGGFSVWLGEPRGGQGKRNDVKSFVDLVKQGKSDLELIEEQPGNYMRFARITPNVRALYQEDRKQAPVCKLYWGPTGTGKCKSCKRFS